MVDIDFDKIWQDVIIAHTRPGGRIEFTTKIHGQTIRGRLL